VVANISGIGAIHRHDLVAVPARAGVGDGGVDFFPVECVVTLRGINVVFVLQVAGRSVHLLGAMTDPDGWWTAP
jgi:hypothetical protein